MKSPFILGTVMLVSSAWFTVVSAQDSAATGSTNAPPASTGKASAAPASIDKGSAPAAPAAVPAKPAASTGKSNYTPPSGAKPGDQRGVIEKIDAVAGTLVVEGKTFKLAPKAKVYVNAESKSLADLKEGDKVAVSFRENPDGTLRATAVYYYKGVPHRARKAKDEASEDKPAKTE